MTVITRYEYYEINGCCEKDLRCDLSKKGCRWDDGKMYDSVTSWSWQWEHDHDHNRKTCAPGDLHLTIEITYRLPSWTRPGDAPASLVKKWDDYLKSLIAHENGHRDMALAAAEEFSAAVAALPPADSCVRLNQMIQDLSRRRMAELNADSRAYDLSTDHGVTQGARFP